MLSKQYQRRMDWTDIHYRQLARLISRHTWLYTEMVVDMTILHSPHTDKCESSTATLLGLYAHRTQHCPLSWQKDSHHVQPGIMDA